MLKYCQFREALKKEMKTWILPRWFLQEKYGHYCNDYRRYESQNRPQTDLDNLIVVWTKRVKDYLEKQKNE